MMMMMEPQTCHHWIGKCREDKCCRKAYHEANYYCKEIKEWKNDSLTEPPTCSDTCRNAYKILFDHPIGKNIKCCECGKFSDVDQSNIGALKGLEACKRARRNMDDFCSHNCSRPAQKDQLYKGNETIMKLLSCKIFFHRRMFSG